MKQRFSSLDLRVIAHELSTSLSSEYRLSNIYDLTSRIFLLKFAKPNSKQLLVIDSGFRCHLTSYHRSTTPTPSSFVSKLRKHLRTRRLTSVRQLGTDRVLELTFSEGRYKLYLEFYAGGNIILCDSEGLILAVLRLVAGTGTGDGDGAVSEVKVGVKYEIPEGRGELRQDQIREIVLETLRFGGRDEVSASGPIEPEEAGGTTGDNNKKAKSSNPPPTRGTKRFKKKKNGEDTLKRVLSTKISEFPPTLIEHALTILGVSPELHVKDVLQNQSLIGKVCEAIQKAFEIAKNTTLENVPKGYIVAKLPKSSPRLAGEKSPEQKNKKSGEMVFGSADLLEDDEELDVPEMQIDEDGYVYDDFHPFYPKQLENVPGVKILEFDGYNNTVDTFFSSIESQKLTTRLLDRKQAAVKRLESARSDHQSRVVKLRETQTLNVRKAQAIEVNLDKVEEAISAVNGLVSQGMDWLSIAKLVEQEKKRGNSVAELIGELKLKENLITLMLGEEFDDDTDDDDESGEEVEEDDDDEVDGKKSGSRKNDPKLLTVDLDLSISAWANARSYYEQKKTAAIKEEKTIESSVKALKSTEKKVLADLKKGLKKEKQLLRPVRQQFWFEKFYFFISSDGHLILGGHDVQQTELLYKRHFKRGDVYIHADIEGAASMIIKNNSSDPMAPIPPSTLSQAGAFSVCASSAWDTKSVMSAWWVTFDQVSKVVEETGEYLSAGTFVIKGAKNYLPPVQLVLGYGVLWLIDDASRANRVRNKSNLVMDVENVEVGVSSKDTRGNYPITIEIDEQKEEEQEVKQEIDEEEDESDDEDFPDVKIESDSEQSGPDDTILDTQGKPQSGELKEEEDILSNTVINPDPVDKFEAVDVDITIQAEGDRTSGAASPAVSLNNNKKRLSAKERRDLKKHQQRLKGATASDGVLELDYKPPPEAIESTPPTPKPMKSAATQAPSHTHTTALPRGKRAKTKKAKEKYALQDEEERELASKFLGATTITSPSHKSGVQGQLSKKEELALQKKAKEEEEFQKKQRRKEQHLKLQQEGKKAEVARQEGVYQEAEEDEESTAPPLDCFIGTPFPGDNVLEAIPVCMPWPAMSNKFKYKAKIQPGTQKKGKAVKEIIMRWVNDGEKGPRKLDESSQDIEKMWPKEKELLKAWKGDEGINSVPVSKIKVFGQNEGNAGKGSKRGGGKGGSSGGKGSGGSKKK